MSKPVNENKDFEMVKDNLPEACNDASIKESDFTLVSFDKQIHEQRFSTKPNTFLKDSLKRFAKNKSSVVASFILGTLLVLSFAVPLFSNSDIKTNHNELRYLEPKLFRSGTGFWDGTKKYVEISTDTSQMPNATTEEEKQQYWWPDQKEFVPNAVSNKKFSDLTFTNSATKYGKEGYIEVGYTKVENKDYVDFASTQSLSKKGGQYFDLNVNNYLESFDTYDAKKLALLEGKTDLDLPNEYEFGKAGLYLTFIENLKPYEIKLLDYQDTFNIGSDIESLKEDRINLTPIIKSELAKNNETKYLTGLLDWKLVVRVPNLENHRNTAVLIRKLEVSTESTNEKLVKQFKDLSFNDATKAMLNEPTYTDENGDRQTNYAYWNCSGVKYMFASKVVYCSFTYDSYEGNLGVKEYNNVIFERIYLDEYIENGWLEFDRDACTYYDNASKSYKLRTDGEYADGVYGRILNEKKCPLAEDIKAEHLFINTDGSVDVTGSILVTYYKYHGYNSMPLFLFGTDTNGYDMFKYVFEGLRTSLLLGIITFAVCFMFGLVWGSICGYYGGTVDLVMERLTDILSGIPWIVVMTLVIIKLGSNFVSFAIALCLTGWIGTAATTRTQFYRFRGREYVLASRTLGASDARLIFKHILPNAMGTIITSAVLMIPSVIFSEATISYLGLGLRNVSSLGVILSDCQSELSTRPHLLIFPAIIIALLMISFNLFGNGLRDAVNPSLKGEGE